METIQKFQDLLKRLFQFETSDLDFGIYRILNYKRERLKKFIQEDLKNKVESAFVRHKDERLTNINQRFEEAKQKVIQGLGTLSFTLTGELKEEFKNTPLGRDFLSIKTQKDEVETIDEIKLQVFNDLYNFFSRYYEEGDFVPQYRHSIKGHKYAIPYNGEEVKLYWANNEQYYTKTGLLFRDYTFKSNDYKVIFRIVSAREELGSKKATKARFFILDDENPKETEDKALIIRFQYRELTEEEVKIYGVEGGSNTAKQEKINQNSFDEVLRKIKDIELKALLRKKYKNEKPLLLYQVLRFTAKNTKDYFIHKNLKKFLSEQLDYFIKAEVLDIETLEKERFLDKHITRAKVVREIGEDIIDFLSQIEDFQKRLWEKKKFVLKTEYVITTDRVPDGLHQEIWTNKGQKNEWKDLGFEIPKTKEDLRKRTLPIDTKYFSKEFKEKLLEKLTNGKNPSLLMGESEGEGEALDDLLDGILIKSENWQALNLLLGKYKEKVQTIYIDPPFNTGKDFLFKDKYQDSSWLALMSNRLELAKNILNPYGSIFLHLDWNADYLGRFLLDKIFGEDNFLNEIIWRIGWLSGYKTSAERFVRNHDVLLSYARDKNISYFDKNKAYIPYCSFKKGTINDEMKSIMKKWNIQKIKNVKITFKDEKWKVLKIGLETKEGRYPIEDTWNCSEYEELHSNKIKRNAKEYTPNGSEITQKPEQLLKRVIELTTKEGEIVLDFFLGSATSAAVAHKIHRKWLGIEFANYFETDALYRMKHVLLGQGYREPCGISKDINWQGGGFFKYQILEQYEDTLDNIELRENKQAELKFGDDYLLKYFLDYETRGNPSLLNIDRLKNPFSYKLKVNLEEVGEPQEMVVDMPETFNYLLGLKVKKIKAREIASPSARNDKKRKYLFILGEKEGKDIAIGWREYDGNWSENDFKEDKEFMIKELEPWASHIVYVNGQSILTPKLGKHTAEIRYIEPEFKRLMEG